jgi:hypothetical protein
MRRKHKPEMYLIFLALLLSMPQLAMGQAQQDLPKDGDDRPVPGELPNFPLER